MYSSIFQYENVIKKLFISTRFLRVIAVVSDKTPLRKHPIVGTLTNRTNDGANRYQWTVQVHIST